MKHLWQFPATYVDNYDGDTITLNMDLGFHTHLIRAVQIDGVDTPEIRGGLPLTKAAAKLSRDKVKEFLTKDPESQMLFRCSQLEEKYGRPLGDIYVNGRSLKAWIIQSKLGVPYAGGTRKAKDHLANIEALREKGWLAPYLKTSKS